jgi:hypothetical protein
MCNEYQPESLGNKFQSHVALRFKALAFVMLRPQELQHSEISPLNRKIEILPL